MSSLFARVLILLKVGGCRWARYFWSHEVLRASSSASGEGHEIRGGFMNLGDLL